MSTLEIEMFDEQENDEWSAHWCEDTTHDMTGMEDEKGAPIFMCTNCGFSAVSYVTSAW